MPARSTLGIPGRSKKGQSVINISVCPPVSVCWLFVPSWLIPEPEVDVCILNNNKKKKSGDIVKEVKIHLQHEWRSYLQIHTDGSKDPEIVRMSEYCSIINKSSFRNSSSYILSSNQPTGKVISSPV